MPHKDPEARRAYHQAYNAEHYPKYYEANADEIRRKKREAAKRKVDSIRARCVEAYGGECACCGDGRVYFLTFDHVNNDGAEHRRELFGGDRPTGRPKGSTYTFLRWLVNNGFPAMIQLLCANCQLGKVRNGGSCPCQEGGDANDPDGLESSPA